VKIREYAETRKKLLECLESEICCFKIWGRRMLSLYTQLGESLESRVYPWLNISEKKQRKNSVSATKFSPFSHPPLRFELAWLSLTAKTRRTQLTRASNRASRLCLRGKPLKAGETRPNYCHHCIVGIPAGPECQGLPGFWGAFISALGRTNEGYGKRCRTGSAGAED
jgi:hypothetical protein